MGHGIAQVCIQAGYATTMKDVSRDLLDRALAKAKENLDFLVGKGKIAESDRDKALSLLSTTCDTAEAVSATDIIIEYEWKNGAAIIDTSTANQEITPIHLLAVQVNEAVRVLKEGIAASAQDIDDAVKYGMNAFAGPFALSAGIDPSQIVNALNYLHERYRLEFMKTGA